MKCNYIVALHEVTIRNYTLIEDEGLNALVAGKENVHVGNIDLTYEDDEEIDGAHVIVITGKETSDILKFLAFSELLVKIIF